MSDKGGDEVSATPAKHVEHSTTQHGNDETPKATAVPCSVWTPADAIIDPVAFSNPWYIDYNPSYDPRADITQPLSEIGRGHHASVFLVHIRRKPYALKVYHEDDAEEHWESETLAYDELSDIPEIAPWMPYRYGWGYELPHLKAQLAGHSDKFGKCQSLLIAYEPSETLEAFVKSRKQHFLVHGAAVYKQLAMDFLIMRKSNYCYGSAHARNVMAHIYEDRVPNTAIPTWKEVQAIIEDSFAECFRTGYVETLHRKCPASQPKGKRAATPKVAHCRICFPFINSDIAWAQGVRKPPQLIYRIPTASSASAAQESMDATAGSGTSSASANGSTPPKSTSPSPAPALSSPCSSSSSAPTAPSSTSPCRDPYATCLVDWGRAKLRQPEQTDFEWAVMKEADDLDMLRCLWRIENRFIHDLMEFPDDVDVSSSVDSHVDGSSYAEVLKSTAREEAEEQEDDASLLALRQRKPLG